jgi:hypothetical protein
VYQEVNRSERRLHRGNQILHLGPTRDVAPDAEDTTLTLGDLICHTSDLILRSRAYRHGGARVTQCQGDGPPDSAARANDQRDLSI